MTGNPDVMGVGILLLVAGISIFLAGLSLVKKFRNVANYSGIGSFRFTRGGAAWLAGYLLVIFGLASVFVSVMLLFL
ncbi:MAG TPA: hypothetical protein PK036_08085 [Geobacteraceae bacterium]|nr:hypothetical protein [Geobacteraceae bacterium]